jgi:pyruvate/2-oxoglutarate dehydrogenase complex dihydrolipoamide acyltransferase (E2) component
MEIKIPPLGGTVTEAFLATWLVADGAFVRVGDPIYVLETDKASTDIESPGAGALQILKEPGGPFPVGTVIGKLRTQFRRAESTLPVAPNVNVTDETMFESPSGDKKFVLPRYALATDVVEMVVEPRIVITDVAGVPVLFVSFAKIRGAAPPVEELTHSVGTRLTIMVPETGAPHATRKIVFPKVQLDASGQVLTAELPLSTIGLREQLIAAFGSLEANATLIIARTISVAVPTGTTFPDGEKAYIGQDFTFNTIVPPSPLILSERHRDRLAGQGDNQ